MELIFHIVVGIQHQMHFTELSGCFGGIARSGCLGEVSLQQLPMAVRACSDAQQLPVHAQLCLWLATYSSRVTNRNSPKSLRLSDWLRWIPFMESFCAYTRDPSLPQLALGTQPAWDLGLDAPLSPAAGSSSSTCSQASYCNCSLFDGCWQSHTGIHTHNNRSNHLP